MASMQASETKNIITGLLISTPLRCTLKQLCDDFRNTVGYNIPVGKLGFANVEAYLRSIPDTVQVFGSGSSAEVKVVVKEKSAHINVMVAKQRKDNIPAHKRKNIKVYQNSHGASTSRQGSSKSHISSSTPSESDCKSRIPKNVQNNLRKLMMKFPDGIWCRKLPREYCKLFGHEIGYHKYQFRSLIEMCSELPEIFHIETSNKEDFMLLDRNKVIPSLNQNEIIVKKQRDEEFPVVELPEFDWTFSSELIPGDVMNLSDVIPSCLLSEIKLGDYLDVNIGEIYSLNKFFVYIKTDSLESLTNALKEFFNAQRNRYLIPELLLELGLYCIILHQEEYHRCVIIDLLPQDPGFVQVLFIDYGSIGNVPSKEIWFLPKKFGDLPSLAIRATLSNIASCHPKSVDRFRQLITNKELVAEILGIDKEKSVLKIYLADITNTERITYINDILVDENVARYC